MDKIDGRLYSLIYFLYLYFHTFIFLDLYIYNQHFNEIDDGAEEKHYCFEIMCVHFFSPSPK